MTTHDLKCELCGHVEEDCLVPTETICDGHATKYQCPNCFQYDMTTYYGLWDDVIMEDGGRSRTDRYDRNGMIKNFTAKDDSLAMIELGFHNKNRPSDRSLQTFNADQVVAFRNRLLVDGDSSTLRKEILATREANIAGKV